MATNNTNLNARITSLVKYVLDIKPYHTKLLGFTSEVSFNDSLSLSLTDSQPQHTLYHQNVWGSVDVPSMAFVSDGSESSKIIAIPPTVMPRFSVSDAVNYDQHPIGDDQALDDLTDVNNDGVPDASYPWPGTPTFSHQVGSDAIPVRLQISSLEIIVTAATLTAYTATVTGSIFMAYPTAVGIPLTAIELRVRNGPTVTVNAQTGLFTTTISGNYTQLISSSLANELIATAYLYSVGIEAWAVNDTGRFYVPFHNGSKVRVNNSVKIFGADNDYIVDSSRSFIQFMSGKHPGASDNIDINLFNSDKLFISICDPFVQAEQGYDMTEYDIAPYDVTAQADHYVIQVDNSATNRYISTFVNLQPGTSKAKLDQLMVYPSEASGNIWQLVANGLFSMTVQQVHPFTGPIEHAIINEPFDNGKLAFTLRSPWIEYYITSGPTSYIAYDMLLFDNEHYESPPDEADFWPGNDIVTMYGQPIDPLPPKHPPVVFNALGELKQRDINGQSQYIFEFFTAPPQGSFVELRVEQAKQLNPRLQLSMHERLSIVQLTDSSVYDRIIYATHELDGTVITAPPSALNNRTTESGDNRITENGDQLILES